MNDWDILVRNVRTQLQPTILRNDVYPGKVCYWCNQCEYAAAKKGTYEDYKGKLQYLRFFSLKLFLSFLCYTAIFSHLTLFQMKWLENEKWIKTRRICDERRECFYQGRRNYSLYWRGFIYCTGYMYYRRYMYCFMKEEDVNNESQG